MAAGSFGSRIRDHSRQVDVTIGGTINGARVGLYDYDRQCDFYGELPLLFDRGAGCKLELEFLGTSFAGFDDASGTAFFGAVDGGDVWLFDGQTHLGYRFSVEALQVVAS